MGMGFLSRILPGCQHQFAWPRRDESGAYYQLCVTCGCKYAYDWTRMCRTRKVSNECANDFVATERPSERKPSWTPRERRLRYRVPVSVRVSGSEEWQQATSENISRSGLLLTSSVRMEENQRLELKLEMPRELTGETSAEVVCRGVVARVSEAGKSEGHEKFLVACSIDDYDFANKPPNKLAVKATKIFAIKKRQNVG